MHSYKALKLHISTNCLMLLSQANPDVPVTRYVRDDQSVDPGCVIPSLS
jgi:hypothetical protein